MPFVPGGTSRSPTFARRAPRPKTYGLPLALKASGGGGGKGFKVARTLDEIESAFETARREAQAYFKNGTIYAERYLDNPKHVELQMLADKHGNVVHVGERDCSLQRRHQKLWEETPALVLRRACAPRCARQACARLPRSATTRSERSSAWSAGDAFYFLEMNTRIQVEHTVTEMISGIDLIREQIRVAAGEPLGYEQSDVAFRGFAIEGRVNAEDPARSFRPAPGTITAYREPGGLGVRVDSAAYPGWTIPAEYDSLIAKLVVWAPTRDARDRAPAARHRRVRRRGRADDAADPARAVRPSAGRRRHLRHGDARSVRGNVCSERFASRPRVAVGRPHCGRRRGLGRRDDSRRGQRQALPRAGCGLAF